MSYRTSADISIHVGAEDKFEAKVVDLGATLSRYVSIEVSEVEVTFFIDTEEDYRNDIADKFQAVADGLRLPFPKVE